MTPRKARIPPKLLIPLAVAALLLLFLLLYRPIPHFSPDRVEMLKVVSLGLPDQEVPEPDRTAILTTINDIPFFFPDIRPWKKWLGGNTLNTQLVIYETSGRITRIMCKPDPHCGSFSVSRNGKTWTSWLIDKKWVYKLETMFSPYVWASMQEYQGT